MQKKTVSFSKSVEKLITSLYPIVQTIELTIINVQKNFY